MTTGVKGSFDVLDAEIDSMLGLGDKVVED